MFHFTYRHLLSVLLSVVGATFLNAQTAKVFTPGTRVQVQNCRRVEMQAVGSGRLEILASPSSRARVMGYTDQPVAADVEIPANMQYWLECVDEGAAYAEAHPGTEMGTTSANAASTVVEPLLGGIEWDQSEPYDQLCPLGTPVGCVATAMAQVMLYWKHPEQGVGEHTWRWDGVTHHVDFGATTYQWDLMFDSYSRWATEAQKAEVAKLSYHCGVSIDMMYAKEGSGTYSQHVPCALKKYFDYNDRVTAVRRTNYSCEAWKALITRELLEGRPVLYSGSNDESGHAFVIDGIDADGLFHVNWGWGGWYNGYFDICILNPTGTGIGATLGELGFCMGQDAVIQICPTKGTGELYGPVNSGGVWENHNEWGFVASTYIENITYDTIQGVGGIQIFDTRDQLIDTQLTDTLFLYPLYTYEFDRNHFYFGEVTAYGMVENLADGDYYARLCYKALSGDSLIYDVPTHHYQNPRLDFTVTNGKISNYTSHENQGNVLTATGFNLLNEELACGKPYEATIEVTNTGDDVFCGDICLQVLTERGQKSGLSPYYDPNLNIIIPAGGTYTAHIPVTITKEGRWMARFAAHNCNMDYRVTAATTDTTFCFSTRYTDESPSKLHLRESVQLLTERCEVDGPITFQFILQNEGGRFSDLLGMRFYASKTATGNASFTIQSESEVAMGAKADTVLVTGVLSEAKGMKKYFALPYYRDINGEDQPMMLIDSQDNETSPSPIEVRVYNATGIEAVTRDDDSRALPAYDLYGRPVEGQGRIIIKNGRKIAVQL